MILEIDPLPTVQLGDPCTTEYLITQGFSLWRERVDGRITVIGPSLCSLFEVMMPIETAFLTPGRGMDDHRCIHRGRYYVNSIGRIEAGFFFGLNRLGRSEEFFYGIMSNERKSWIDWRGVKALSLAEILRPPEQQFQS